MKLTQLEFFLVIYTPTGVYPHDFDCGYADRGIITSKKFYNTCHRSQFEMEMLGTRSGFISPIATIFNNRGN
jgi:hypothetical protein